MAGLRSSPDLWVSRGQSLTQCPATSRSTGDICSCLKPFRGIHGLQIPKLVPSPPPQPWTLLSFQPSSCTTLFLPSIYLPIFAPSQNATLDFWESTLPSPPSLETASAEQRPCLAHMTNSPPCPQPTRPGQTQRISWPVTSHMTSLTQEFGLQCKDCRIAAYVPSWARSLACSLNISCSERLSAVRPPS